MAPPAVAVGLLYGLCALRRGVQGLLCRSFDPGGGALGAAAAAATASGGGAATAVAHIAAGRQGAGALDGHHRCPAWRRFRHQVLFELLAQSRRDLDRRHADGAHPGHALPAGAETPPDVRPGDGASRRLCRLQRHQRLAGSPDRGERRPHGPQGRGFFDDRSAERLGLPGARSRLLGRLPELAAFVKRRG